MLMSAVTRRTGAAGAILAMLAVMTACGDAGSPAAQSPARFADMFVGYQADYDPVGSTAELAIVSDVVVMGRISQIVPGLIRSFTPDDSLTYQTTILQFEVDEVLAGRIPSGAGRMVYVELPAPDGYTAAEFDRAAPKDAPAILYLVELPDPREWTERILNPDAGRPPDQPLMAVTSPQGFIVSAGEGEAVMVLEYSGHPVPVPLARFLPSAGAPLPVIDHDH